MTECRRRLPSPIVKMDAQEAKIAELEQLLWQMRDGAIDAAGRARIEALVTGDAAVRRFYIRYSTLCGGLRWLNAQEEGSGFGIGDSGLGIRDWGFGIGGSGAPVPSSQSLAAVGAAVELPHQQRVELPHQLGVPTPESAIPPIIIDSSPTIHYPLFTIHSQLGGWLFSYAAATVLMGMAILGAWAYKVSLDYQLATVPNSRGLTGAGGRDAGEVTPPQPALVGRITGTADCRWADTDDARLGPAVPLGRKFALASGLLEIAYDSGAKVILQGPCTYEVESLRGGFLSLGKLTARVESGEWRVESGKSEIRNPKSEISNPLLPLPSPLFSVRTPTAVVTDLGTEFGVEVDEQGRTESQVFVGRVRLEVVEQPGGRNAERVLHAGQAVRVDRSGVVAAPANSSDVRFVRELTAPEAELIGQIDYSDTWTVNSPARYGGYRVLTSPGELQVEQCHGNPPRSWVFSDPTAVTTWPSGSLSTSWPGFGVRGALGFQRNAAGHCPCGCLYGLRVRPARRLRSTVRRRTDSGSHQHHHRRRAGHGRRRPVAVGVLPGTGGPYPEIGLFTASNGEVDTGLHSGIPAPYQWHNYAVRFNLREKRLTVWVDRQCRGTIDLAGVARGMRTQGQRTWVSLFWSNQYVTVGGYTEKGEGRVWTDNFRVGTPAKGLVQEKPVTEGGKDHEVDVTK